MWDDRSDPFDAGIDTVARRMTDVAAPPDLRARVLDRIEAGNRRRRSVAAWAWTSGAIAAAAVTAAVFVRSGAPPAPYQPKAIVGIAQSHVVQAFGPARQPDHKVRTTRRTSPLADATTQRGMRTEPGRDETPRDIQSIGDLELSPLTVSPMELPAIGPPETRPTEPLQLMPLSVTPLSSEGEK
jgi:hypothetical protein